ncbi:MAG TPA: PDZ domain-containing protein, partial [Thermoanaerobaculia bacterium]|nr:PDZ domain-containing protein [Thermoanaerobaculia bacterium]
MKTKSVVLLCWVQVVIAAVLVLLNLTSMTTRPWLGIESARTTGIVLRVIPGGPVDRAGVREGDRVITLNGHKPGRNVVPLYFARAGEPVEIVVERGGRTLVLTATPSTQEQMRREQLGGSFERVLQAINSYLAFPLHLWMLGLGIALLVLRPGNKDARLAALSLAYWAGTTVMFRAPGFGTVLEPLPAMLHAPLYVIDAFFVANFFAINFHFALTFPSDRSRVRRIWEVIPYLAVVPIFIEALAHNMRRLDGDVRPVELPWYDAYATIGTALLIVSLGTLVVRFTRVEDGNARRRLQLIFLAMLPGSIAFFIAYVVQLLQAARWDHLVHLLHTPAMILGSFICADAVVRHRIFNVRVLVRRSLQYALARGTLLALMSLPVFGL